MRLAWVAYKDGSLDDALHRVKTVAATDWQLASVEWLERKVAARTAKAAT
jgi:hypothetical protein